MSCDAELKVGRDVDLQALAGTIAEFLDSRGAPRGSTVVDEGGTVLATFGVTEGLALYLNGTDLPAEVYAASDTNEIVDAVNAAVGGSGRVLSSWHGPEDTALCLPSEEAMRGRLANLLAHRHDMQPSRLESVT